ncbi:neo-calmodulin [Lepeophtheirus salmonis]|uniref:Squidulin n=1 Tax=Lepeophtheirus salmonis TaxID=72036 RepID=D3PHF9_LEPSM|nr:neo-calmodulin-like [Lepeophtheirus salmonis]XP_040564929.1 neo-calmodulin-like [Lepeophtheirus salmonis]XP_040564931.1 neo-calmodulin-like [Lepeophtheirus salmonis]ADD37995.1 Squidulin [Lepeophtheirus salmonis]ADD38257.1 Squidulin [Lepeophtheirus salmonis]ADD38593.1 Squidulin [Lepeophtheirus salmonis]
MSELKEAFELFDEDKNGEISKEELLGLFAKLGNELSPSTLESYFRIASKDNSVGINFEEFKTLWDCLTSPEEISSEIRDEFSRLDEDSDGFITTEEMMSVVNKFSHVLGDRKEIAEKCLKDIDINGDGKVSFPEFYICWKYKAAP